MPRKKDIVDLPVISARQAGVLFGWSEKKFKSKFAEVLHEEIACAREAGRRGYLLTDVLRSAFPEASNHTIHVIAADFNIRAAEKRKKIWSRNGNSERGKDE